MTYSEVKFCVLVMIAHRNSRGSPVTVLNLNYHADRLLTSTPLALHTNLNKLCKLGITKLDL